ncbi:hypothetical protein BDW69DRAFT_169164 [Aspergillus filifer]
MGKPKVDKDGKEEVKIESLSYLKVRDRWSRNNVRVVTTSRHGDVEVGKSRNLPAR